MIAPSPSTQRGRRPRQIGRTGPAGEVVPVRDECGVRMLEPIPDGERVVIRRRNARTVGGAYTGVQAGILAARGLGRYRRRTGNVSASRWTTARV